MKPSVLPVLVALVFIVCAGLVRRARSSGSIDAAEARSVYGLLLAFLAWTAIATVLGLRATHLGLMDDIPFLWQPFVPIVLWSGAFAYSGTLRSGLRGIATSTPGHWLALIQALRIGGLGGILKGIQGEIASDYVLWIGIPDFLFGLSALVMAWLLLQKAVGPGALIAWNLVGFALILLPTFVPMSHWMNEPGFRFIFEFPMVLAPSSVVPTFISLNLLHAWGSYEVTVAKGAGTTSAST